MNDQHSASTAVGLSNPLIAKWLMYATLTVGTIGFFLGFMKMSSEGAAAAIGPVALLSVGVVGVISMVRHSVFHRSDAIRMDWNQGRRNNFQIEAGFANLAIGLPAFLAVALGMEPLLQAAFTFAYALYFIQVTVLVFTDRRDGRINLFRMIMVLMQAGLLCYFSISVMAAEPSLLGATS